MQQDLMVENEERRAAGARARLLAGLPVTERTVALDGVSTAILEGGQGTPLVLLHGPGEHGAKWLRVIPELVRSYRVIAPDLPGHGSSVARAGALDAERILRWLERLIDATCASPPVLLGQTVAGGIAARFAAGRHRPVLRVVLVDTFGLVPFQPAPEFGEALAGFLAGPDEATFAALWRRCAHDHEGLKDAMGSAWGAYAEYSLTRARSQEVQAALHRLMEEFGFAPIPSEVLARIQVPVALIWGRHDLATSLSAAEEASARFGWPLQVVEDAADDPAMEQPERFLAALRAAVG